ncbi:Conserved_hypothetical protein [Hexamita inflata]|uniref:Uncharacterized protein n=1 Tax=Hexamita inflata TaxID=28002 RepID=A0ABP1GK91_9EUKA
MHVNNAQNIFNRKFELVEVKTKSKAKEGHKEREEVVLSLNKQFSKMIQNQQIDANEVVEKLNLFVKAFDLKDINNKRPHNSNELNNRVHRQHALSVIALTVQFLVMTNNVKLVDKIDRIDQLKEQIYQLHPRMEYMLKYETKEQVIAALEKKSENDQVSQFLLKNHALVNAENVADSNASLKLLKMIKLNIKAEIEFTLPNQLLVFDLAQKNLIKFDLLPEQFKLIEALVNPSIEHKNEFLEKNFDALKTDSRSHLALKSLLIQTQSKLSLEMALMDYPYYQLLEYQCPAEFLRQIQVANQLYLTLAQQTFPYYLNEKLTFKTEQEFLETLFVNHKHQNHTIDHEWSFQNVLQAILMNSNETIFQNYKAITTSILEAANVYQAVRMFESKEILNSYQVYYASAIFSCYQVIAQPDFNSLTIEQKNNLFEQNCGKLAGLNAASNTFIYSDIVNLEDQSFKYFLKQSTEQQFTLLEQNKNDRKKCSKPCLTQKVPRNEIFDFLQEAPVLSRSKTEFSIQALKLHIFVRHLFLKMNGAESNLIEFAQQFLKENTFDQILNKLLKGETDVEDLLKKLCEEEITAEKYLIQYPLLKTAFIILNMKTEEETIKQALFK